MTVRVSDPELVLDPYDYDFHGARTRIIVGCGTRPR